jgi:hypothetical protein
MKKLIIPLFFFMMITPIVLVNAADSVPNEIQMPGTQPNEVSNLQSIGQCYVCHGGYDETIEPAHSWRGSMMANAGRDPIFWATLAIAEQDFDGAGDLCIRCHSPNGWVGGRSTPTDGSALTAGDAEGVECDLCHKITNPDNSELIGVQNDPFIANDGGIPPNGYYGSGMYVLWGGSEKLGPYGDAIATHQFEQSQFHRSVDFCGVCHDVSNPAVGDLAHNNGAQVPLELGSFSGQLGSPVEVKAAFNNFPYQYGIAERTFSEFISGLLSETLVSDYFSLPSELQSGAIKAAYESAILSGTGGNYEDGTPRYFSCQTCHLRPVNGTGCVLEETPVRTDLPLHDMTGGNYWIPDAIQHLDAQGKLRLGGGLTANQIAALNDGKIRAMKQLSEAASISASGHTLRLVNLTGHKLISGYPEGRRMWLNIKWYDGDGILLREDGEYGAITVNINGTPTQVETILDLNDPNTKIYETHYGMTQEWAQQLRDLGYPEALPLSYNRVTGDIEGTLGQLASGVLGTEHETFHFVLNNAVIKDNRIPSYSMSYDEAKVRNALPVPADQYGNPGPGGTYNYWDEIKLNPPPGAHNATIDLLYQPTSWEYIQFLYLANDRQNAFLADEGAYLLEAWLDTAMAYPYIMASTQMQDIIVNSLPTAPVVDVTPDQPHTGIDLVCNITSPSTDPDGDTITYTYQWYRDGALQPSMVTETVSAANTDVGEVWRCVVVPSDGWDDGPGAYDEVTIGEDSPTEPATITDATPDFGEPGDTLNVIITGTNFNGTTAVDFGAWITVNSFVVDNPTQIIANITIAADSTSGVWDVSVTTPLGTYTLEDRFTVRVITEITSLSIWIWVGIGLGIVVLGLVIYIFWWRTTATL